MLFSAALPGKIDLHHAMNSYQISGSSGLPDLDFNVHDLRPRIWTDQRIPTWYRQNMLLFSRDKSPQDECLRSIPRSVSIAHPDLIHMRLSRQAPGQKRSYK
jgi:hypothetical protein